MRLVSCALAALLSLAVAGCETFEGAHQVIGEGGQPLPPANSRWPLTDGQPPSSTALDDCKKIFLNPDATNAKECDAILNYVIAYHVAETYSVKGANEDTVDSTKASKAAEQLALKGAYLVRNYCKSFFAEGGSSQKWISVARDILITSGSAAAGVLSIASPANATASAVLSLTTSTASQTLDIYTRNFLFGSDNIEAVRIRTMKTISDHEMQFQINIDNSAPAAVPGAAAAAAVPWTFEMAEDFVEEQQHICTPSKIRSDVINAIAGVAPKPATP